MAHRCSAYQTNDKIPSSFLRKGFAICFTLYLKEELNKSASVRREAVAELAAKGMSKEEIWEFVFGFAY